MAILSNSIQNHSGSASPSAPARSRTFRSGNSTLHLQEGQTLKGVISDVHGNEITLHMEDGSSFTGKLPDANQYSIGQKAAFQITSLDQNTIYMKAVGSGYLLDMEDTIEQALEEANLPKSARNLDVVRSLLGNQQSISRESILSAIRLCARFPEADVNSVITMNRLNMPLTPESVKQFQNYQNQGHQLLYQMESLGDSLGDMLNSIGNQVPRLAKEVGTQLLALALEGNPSPEEAELLADTAAKEAPPADATGTAEQTSGQADQAEQTGIAGSAETAGQNMASAVAGEQAPGAAESPQEKAAQEGAPQEKPLPAENANEAAKGGNTAGPFAKMRQLISSFAEGGVTRSEVQSEIAGENRPPFIHEQAGSILSASDREAFSKFLSDYPLPEEIKQKMVDGTITARQFLTEIQKAFPEMTEEQAGKLLASKPFQAMVKGQFMSGWTISPEHLKDEDALEETYRKMSRQFDALSHFSERVLGRDVFSQVTNTASQMNDNLDFMKLLNQTFQYIQLPLKLQNQNTHGDLYVMTRKEALKKNPKNLKVLLHLEMDHLGTLDIHITRDNSAVSARFFVDTAETKNLLSRNIDLLGDALGEQGFSFSSELALREKEIDVVKDFIAAEAPVGDLKRYNFDLRA